MRQNFSQKRPGSAKNAKPGPRKPFGKRPEAGGFSKPRGDDEGFRKPRDRDDARTERTPNERKWGDRKPAGKGFGDKKPSDKKFGEKKWDGPRQERGERPQRSWDSDRPQRTWDDKPKRAFGDKKPGGKKFGEKKWDNDRPARTWDDKPKRSFGDKPFRGKEDGAARGGRSFDKPFKKFDRGQDKPFGKPGFKERAERTPRFDDDARQHSKFFVKKDQDLLFGLHAVSAALANPARKLLQLWLTPEAEAALADRLDAPTLIAITRTTKAELDQKMPGNVHQGCVLLAESLPVPDFAAWLSELTQKDRAVVVLLDQVTDPHNIGAILRSAAAFGADGLITTERNTPLPTGVLAKTASGALELVPWLRVVNLARAIDDLKAAGIWCIGLAESGTSLKEVDHTGKVALVLGAEGEGLRRLTKERCDAVAALPTVGEFSTLNVSNAATVALYEVTQR